jgi:hypothetical protein
MVAPAAGLPERVTVYEVGARDGLQNEPTSVPVEVKAEFVRRLAAAGPDDDRGRPASCTRAGCPSSPTPPSCSPTSAARRARPAGAGAQRAGLDRALEAGVRHVAVFASATETFAQRNLNRSLDGQFAMFEPVLARALAAGAARARLRLDVLRRPVGGPRRPAQVAAVARRLTGLGCHQVSLGDTIGTGTPGPRRRRAGRLRGRRAWASTGSRCTSTTPTARPGQHPRRAAPRGHHRRRRAPAAWAGAPTPSRPPATSPPRTSSGCSTAWASPTASTSTRSWPPARGWRSGWAGRPRRGGAGARRLTHDDAALVGGAALVGWPQRWSGGAALGRWAQRAGGLRLVGPCCASPPVLSGRLRRAVRVPNIPVKGAAEHLVVPGVQTGPQADQPQPGPAGRAARAEHLRRAPQLVAPRTPAPATRSPPRPASPGEVEPARTASA